MSWLRLIFMWLRSFFAGRAALAAENLALRQQLALLQRERPRPKLRDGDRRCWVWLASWILIYGLAGMGGSLSQLVTRARW